jgi:hypothetical protein
MAKEIFLNSSEFLSSLTVVGTLSATTFVSPNSPNWDSVYSSVQSNSASYATTDFADNKFFALTGGIISGATRFNGNVTIFGDLSSTGTQTFANTVFTTTSSLSVLHIGGSGPALIVSQEGTGDIASFYDLDENLEVLHVGGVNSTFPNVGVKVSNPNKDFTVKGELSASGDIWTSGRILSGGQELLSIIEPSISNIYNTVNSNSAVNWNYQGTDLKELSGNWQSAYTDFSSNSASFATSNFVQSNFLPLSGGTIDGDLTITGQAMVDAISAIALSGTFYGDGSNLIGASLPGQATINTLVQTNSAAWSAAVVYIKRFDYIADGIDYSYSGLALENTLDTDSTWKITRSVFTDVGALSASGVAQNVTWNERLTATYI